MRLRIVLPRKLCHNARNGICQTNTDLKHARTTGMSNPEVISSEEQSAP